MLVYRLQTNVSNFRYNYSKHKRKYQLVMTLFLR